MRALLVAAGEPIGVVVGHLPATRRWERADQDLLELFAIEVAASIRNAQLYAKVDDQNRRLVELDEAKDDFLRGVSHNLQTPLASIRGYAQQLAADTPDRRLVIITEQADRLSRMVRQLLTVSRIESGALRPRLEVFSPGRARPPDVGGARRDRRAVHDRRPVGRLAGARGRRPARPGAVGAHRQRRRVRRPDGDRRLARRRRGRPATCRSRSPTTGPGVADEDRERLFLRFERGTARPADEGSGLGLYVSRELCRAMSGDLVLEPAEPGRGAAFTIHLPAEAAEES